MNARLLRRFRRLARGAVRIGERESARLASLRYAEEDARKRETEEYHETRRYRLKLLHSSGYIPKTTEHGMEALLLWNEVFKRMSEETRIGLRDSEVAAKVAEIMKSRYYE